jgi:8-oxo-dGTP diphosphatase
MPTDDSATIIDVVVAIILHPDGRFLLTCRPEGKPYAGYWEFPGGKVESGESLPQALNRELWEELGLQIDLIHPWITRVFTYPHATVRLHFFRVLKWHGEPRGRENQSLSWQFPDDIRVRPMLPANEPIIRLHLLPSQYAITLAEELGIDASIKKISVALQEGLQLIQIREKNMAIQDLRQFSQAVISLVHRHHAKVLINGDVEFAREMGADGVHLTASQLMTLSSRPDIDWCSASCHNSEELYHAEQLGVDFVVVGPVLPTLSHPGCSTLGWQKFAALIRHYSLPTYALGGLRPDDIAIAQELGGHGIAMMRGW